MKRLIQILFGIFLFTFPLSIRWVVYEQASYRFGSFNPWATGFVYLPEILLGVIFVLWFIQKVRDKETVVFKAKSLWLILLLFVINAFVVTLLKGDSILGALFLLRLFEGLIVFWLITDRILEPKQIVGILFLGAFAQIIWGYFQWKFNHSLGLTFLGESVLGPDVLGVAKIDLAEGVKQIRAYGSFLHPNIFAAYLLAIFFISLKYLKYGYKLLWFGLFTWGIYLTHSRAAMLVGLIGLGISFLFLIFRSKYFRKAIALIIVLVLAIANFWFFKNSHAIQTNDIAWQERLEQNVVSQNIWQENPLGVGIQNFTLQMEQVTPEKLLPWEFQPVHNTYFLILNEVGIQGLVILIAFLFLLFFYYWKVGKAIPILILLLLAPLDHFLWDSWMGIMLIAIVAGFFVLENKHKETLIAPEE